MSLPRRVPQHWLYRLSRLAIDVNHHRAIWGFTWLSTDPPVSDVNTVASLSPMSFGLQFPFGAADPINYSASQLIFDELYPERRSLQSFNIHAVTPTPILNPRAPEASFRLQRVGASGHHKNCGRILFPIRDDSWFTDLPHRRHVDVARFAPKFAAHFPTFGNSVTAGGRTYTHVIYNRLDNTWVNVVSHVLERSVSRVWHRLRRYDPNQHVHSDAVFVPPEVPLST